MQCATPYQLKEPDSKGQAQIVPCGQCGACRHNRRVDWSFRLKEEMKNSETCYFLTLTYNNENLPQSDYTNTGTLYKPDFQRFIKRLRKAQTKFTQQKIRYYGVGEYGTTTHRPHYHAIAFNINIHTLQLLPTLWKLGHIRADPINEARIHYITKYHVNFDKQARKGIKEPEFALMSRKPGIGHQYVERAKKWHNDNGNLYVVNNGYKQNLPRYLRNKIFTEDRLKELQAERTKDAWELAWEERERLEKLGIQQPEKYIKQSKQHQADLVKKKGGQTDQL